MYLIIDIGNTRIKTAVFDNSELIKTFTFVKSNLLKSVKSIISDYTIEKGIVSSVNFISNDEFDELKQLLPLLVLNHGTKVPFNNKYKTPKTLGVDRIALVSAGVSSFPNKNVLIIDAGTCITYDFVSDKTVYLGGAISPGIRLRYKALHDYTANLPELEISQLDNFIGVDTNTSIHSGVINGVVNEIDGVINQYKDKFKDLTIVLTGGDTFFLSKQLKSVIFANQNFLLEGLYRILNFNK